MTNRGDTQAGPPSIQAVVADQIAKEPDRGGRLGKGGGAISRAWAIAALGVGGGVLLVGAVALHIGPFAPASTATSQPAAQPGVPVAALKPYGVGLTGATADLKFAGFVPGPCPAAAAGYMSPTFGGGWRIAVTSAAVPTDQSANLLGLATSPLAVAMNGSLGPTGNLDVSGDSNIEFMHLTLAVPLIPPGPIRAPVDVTGSADVRLHLGGAATGDCSGTYSVTGTIAPP